MGLLVHIPYIVWFGIAILPVDECSTIFLKRQWSSSLSTFLVGNGRRALSTRNERVCVACKMRSLLSVVLVPYHSFIPQRSVSIGFGLHLMHVAQKRINSRVVRVGRGTSQRGVQSILYVGALKKRFMVNIFSYLLLLLWKHNPCPGLYDLRYNKCGR